MYGQPGAYAPPPGRRSPGRREALAWLVSATLVVIAAVVIIEVVLTRGSSSPHADRSTTPSVHSTSPDTSSSDPDGVPSGAPTTDVLPKNAESSLCGTAVAPQFVAVAVATVVSSAAGGKPSAYARGVLKDCASATVRSRITELYGKQFGTDYSGDLSGGNNAGRVAAYTVSGPTGNVTLRLDLTKQHDGHYEVTDYTYG